MSDIEGKAAREAASECGQRASFNGATGMSDMAEGWNHDLGGVFSGRVLREQQRYILRPCHAEAREGGSTTDHPLLPS